MIKRKIITCRANLYIMNASTSAKSSPQQTITTAMITTSALEDFGSTISAEINSVHSCIKGNKSRFNKSKELYDLQ